MYAHFYAVSVLRRRTASGALARPRRHDVPGIFPSAPLRSGVRKEPIMLPRKNTCALTLTGRLLECRANNGLRARVCGHGAHAPCTRTANVYEHLHTITHTTAHVHAPWRCRPKHCDPTPFPVPSASRDSLLRSRYSYRMALTAGRS